MISRIKAKIYAMVFWQSRLGEIVNKAYDMRIFYTYSFTDNRLKSRQNFHAFLTKQYHIVEKGLALPDPRKGFGKPKITLLISRADDYQARFGSDKLIENIKETIQQYLHRNPELQQQDPPYFALLSGFVQEPKPVRTGGVKTMDMHALRQHTSIDFESFVKSRTSVRNFSPDEVPFAKLQKAVDLARFAPSVCNRQSWKVHHITNQTLMRKLLIMQGGNGGFTDSINQLLIVTTDVHRFTKLESNQIFTDGGLFSMNLLLGLHAQGIGSCCLNTCVTYIVEKQIKKSAHIPDSERLIMMIGIGMLKENFEVAISDRLEVGQILVSNH